MSDKPNAEDEQQPDEGMMEGDDMMGDESGGQIEDSAEGDDIFKVEAALVLAVPSEAVIIVRVTGERVSSKCVFDISFPFIVRLKPALDRIL